MSDELCLLSTKEFVDVEVIDGGDTVVVKFEGADCRTVGVMMSRRVMQGMVRALGGLAAEAEPADRLRLGTEASGG
ncbi:hypothetical protein ASG52_16440 [Methylobacterium sp. Leaf456]|uniref:hypothetical protein n=1 Tax=Methylobacterium sp. Leaf456 TaxID=1736382 RepID=UPI0006F85301|nr:hypothetical protein [Methylobacterium sp. Leaf456]KQT60836.1 hypothetical protein ASG52_16440 [Methylobacterium sp. Leaf456]